MPPSDSERAPAPAPRLDELNLVNAGYVADLYEQYRADPASVAAERRAAFDAGSGGDEPVAPRAGETNGRAETAAASAEPASQGARHAAAEAPEPDTEAAQQAAAEAPNPDTEAPTTPPPASAAAALPDGATPIKGPAARLAQNM